MTNRLQRYFPMIRSREEVRVEIENRPDLKAMFQGWQENQQELFLDFCTGVRGVKVLYDFMFKEILNPEAVPERVSELLSLLLGKNVKVIAVLPNDGARLADESSLLVMDIVVELQDGSLCNVEIQKIGYMFPGARSACYSADLLLRQYKRVRDKRKKKFSYKDIKTVCTIVLFEKSPREFHAFPKNWLHHFEQKSDTGLKLDLLQKFLFIPLDIFKETHYNSVIETKLEAWLAFLCMDDADTIIQVCEKYPEFKSMYGQVYGICRNIEGVMSMYSEELRELDRNTVQLMIDEMQAEINRQKAVLQQKEEALNQKEETINQKEETINQKEETINQKVAELNEQKSISGQKDIILNQQEQLLREKEEAYQDALRRIKELEAGD